MTQATTSERTALDEIFARAEAMAEGRDIEVSMGEGPASRVDIEEGDWPEGQTGTVYPNKMPSRLVPVFHTETGVASFVLPYMIEKMWLRDRLPDGRCAWSRKPTKVIPSPTVPCIFNPNHPMRAEIEAAGIYIQCRKMLITEFDATYHAEHRHRHEWATLKGNQKDSIESEEREFRRLQMEVMRRQLGENPSPSALGPKSIKPSVDCDECGKAFKDRRGLHLHKMHKHSEPEAETAEVSDGE